jgi:hypothetical protein
MKKTSVILISISIILLIVFFARPEDSVDFSTDVKPILNKHCISCHGGVKKNGGFSLLFEHEALAVNDSGFPAIVPGHPEQSELIKRLLENDPELRMPYSKPALSSQEIDVLKKWIKQGAKWGEHWAHQTVQKPEIPGKIPKYLFYVYFGRLIKTKIGDKEDFIVINNDLSCL